MLVCCKCLANSLAVRAGYIRTVPYMENNRMGLLRQSESERGEERAERLRLKINVQFWVKFSLKVQRYILYG